MKRQALPLKFWFGLLIAFVVFQFISRLYFEEKIFYPRDSTSLSDGHFYKLEQDFKNAKENEIKVAVLGSSRVAKGIECPDAIHNILEKKGQSPIQLNKVWESFDPFEMFVEQKHFLQRLIPLKPDLICIQAEMLAIQMTRTLDVNQMSIEEKHKKIWDLEYKGKKENYLPKKLKYQSKVNQELVHSIINSNLFDQGKEPCFIHDNYANIDTLKERNDKGILKTTEDIAYALKELKMLYNADIKVVIIETPYPSRRRNAMFTNAFKSKFNAVLDRFNKEFGIDYWEYSGRPLHYKHYADGGHLNPEGRQIYTEWLLDKIQLEVSK